MSSTCFQVNWLMYEVPKVLAFSRSCLLSEPVGSSFLKKTLGIEVMMWKCFEIGSTFMNTRMTQLCTHHPRLLAKAAKPAPPMAAKPAPTRALSGCHALSRAITSVCSPA